MMDAVQSRVMNLVYHKIIGAVLEHCEAITSLVLRALGLSNEEKRVDKGLGCLMALRMHLH